MSPDSTSPVPKAPERTSRAAPAALFLVPLIGCTPGEALAATIRLGLAFLSLLAFTFAWSGICHAVSLVWPRLSPALRRLVLRIGWVAVFWLLSRYWSTLVAPLSLDPVVSALGLGAVFVVGLRQVVLLGVSLAELLEQPHESLIRPRRESPGAWAPPAGPADRSLTRGQVQAGPTCWICGGVNDGHQH